MTQFVSVHFSSGCLIGRNIGETDNTIDVKFANGTIVLGIPKSNVSNWV